MAHDTEITVDGTVFTFPEDWDVSVFDEWPQYRKVAGMLGIPGCDIVARDGETLWIIEMKDYTYPAAAAPTDLAEAVARKTLGTMALLYALQRNPAQSQAQEFARRSARTTRVRMVLHIEVKDGGRKGKQVSGPLMAWKSKLEAHRKALGLDKCEVTSTLMPSPHTPWTARRDPTTRRAHSDR